MEKDDNRRGGYDPPIRRSRGRDLVSKPRELPDDRAASCNVRAESQKSNELQARWFQPPKKVLNTTPSTLVSDVQIKDLQSKLAFLRLQFDNQHAKKFDKPDVKIVIQDNGYKFVYAHKLILSRRSPVFCKMFTTKMLEEETGMVRIDDATLLVMRAVVKFCYDAEITFNDDVTGEEVLAVAHKYEITLLQNICEEHLMETLTSKNLPKRLKLAKKFDVRRLETAATKYLKTHYDNVISSVLTELC